VSGPNELHLKALSPSRRNPGLSLPWQRDMKGSGHDTGKLNGFWRHKRCEGVLGAQLHTVTRLPPRALHELPVARVHIAHNFPFRRRSLYKCTFTIDYGSSALIHITCPCRCCYDALTRNLDGATSPASSHALPCSLWSTLPSLPIPSSRINNGGLVSGYSFSGWVPKPPALTWPYLLATFVGGHRG
jgi:hypothetical protein